MFDILSFLDSIFAVMQFIVNNKIDILSSLFPGTVSNRALGLSYRQGSTFWPLFKKSVHWLPSAKNDSAISPKKLQLISWFQCPIEASVRAKNRRFGLGQKLTFLIWLTSVKIKINCICQKSTLRSCAAFRREKLYTEDKRTKR